MKVIINGAGPAGCMAAITIGLSEKIKTKKSIYIYEAMPETVASTKQANGRNVSLTLCHRSVKVK